MADFEGKGLEGKGQGLEGKGFEGKGFGKGKDLGKGLGPYGPSDWDQFHVLPWNLPDMSLGVLKKANHPDFEALEWLFRKRLWDLATTYWPKVQGGTDEEALEVWKDIWKVLELDADSWMEMMLLVHQGPVGRSEANMILWEVLTKWACSREYKNLSRKVSSLIGASRKAIDRPPDNHRDIEGWSWRKALISRYPEYLAGAVPADPRVITGPGGVPRAPPGCFVPPPPPPPQEPQGASGASGSGGPPAPGGLAPPAPPRRGRLNWR